jgi:hypothetical protein
MLLAFEEAFDRAFFFERGFEDERSETDLLERAMNRSTSERMNYQ